MQEHRVAFAGRPVSPICRAFWDQDRKTIYLRADRTEEQRLLDFKHEIDHVFTDWKDEAYPDPRD